MSDKKIRLDKSSANFVAGAFAGTVTAAVFQPFDVVKTRLIRSAAEAPRGQQRSQSLISMVSQISQQEGIAGFWRGSGASMLRLSTGAATTFTLQSTLFGIIKGPGAEHAPAFMTALVGSASRVCAIVLCCPLSVAKTQIEGSAGKLTTTFGALQNIYRMQGITGWYSGLIATIARDTPFAALNTLFYTRTKAFLGNWSGFGKDHAAVQFSASFFSASTATLITHPFDVVKTLLQLRSVLSPDAATAATSTATSANVPKPPAARFGTVLLSTFQGIVKADGVMGLLRGLIPRLAKRPLNSAVTWTIYEQTVKALGGETNL